ncbi:MAG: Peptidase conserved region, partial [bacterium]|nr:Peptidase conserved region [bacterium]
ARARRRRRMIPASPRRVTPPPSLRPTLAAEFLRDGHVVELPLGGYSMRPLFFPGDVLRVHPARAADLRAGDVVIVDLGGSLLCHRLVYVAGGRVVTRGDDAQHCDPPLPAAAVIGRVEVPPSPRALYCAVRALLR